MNTEIALVYGEAIDRLNERIKFLYIKLQTTKTPEVIKGKIALLKKELVEIEEAEEAALKEQTTSV
jgi:hypothetical protein